MALLVLFPLLQDSKVSRFPNIISSRQSFLVLIEPNLLFTHLLFPPGPQSPPIMGGHKPQITYVVEHLDPELGPWSSLEYGCIARESHAAGARFLLSSVPSCLQMPKDLAATQGLEVEHRSVEEIFADRKSKVCLLDPAAEADLNPADGDQFEVFLFGGILGARDQSS